MLFNDRIMVYTLAVTEGRELTYKAFRKVNLSAQCQGFCVTMNHFLFFNGSTLVCQN